MNISDPKRFLLFILLLCGLLAPAMPLWAASFQGLEGLPEYGGSVALVFPVMEVPSSGLATISGVVHLSGGLFLLASLNSCFRRVE